MTIELCDCYIYFSSISSFIEMHGPNLTTVSRRPTPYSDALWATPTGGLNDVLLVDGLASQHALKAEARDIDRLRASSDNLGDGAPGGRRLLQAVAGEAVTQHHVGHVRVPTDSVCWLTLCVRPLFFRKDVCTGRPDRVCLLTHKVCI